MSLNPSATTSHKSMYIPTTTHSETTIPEIPTPAYSTREEMESYSNRIVNEIMRKYNEAIYKTGYKPEYVVIGYEEFSVLRAFQWQNNPVYPYTVENGKHVVYIMNGLQLCPSRKCFGLNGIEVF